MACARLLVLSSSMASSGHMASSWQPPLPNGATEASWLCGGGSLTKGPAAAAPAAAGELTPQLPRLLELPLPLLLLTLSVATPLLAWGTETMPLLLVRRASSAAPIDT
jgi:hypothetical protein